MLVVKADGRIEEFDYQKIVGSIKKAVMSRESEDEEFQKRAAEAEKLERKLRRQGFNKEQIEAQTEEIYFGGVVDGIYTEFDEEAAIKMAMRIEESINEMHEEVISVEDVSNFVEASLIDCGLVEEAKKFIIYRAKRAQVREMNTALMRSYENLTFGHSKTVDLKRENANIDGDSTMGTMLRYGSEGAKRFNLLFVIPEDISRAHSDGDIHIHDLDFYTLATNCCQIDLGKLFKGGFNTGHGTIREPGEIRSYAALACIAIQSNQNDQFGGQSIPHFDFYLAEGVAKSFVKELVKVVRAILGGCGSTAETLEDIKNKVKELRESDEKGLILHNTSKVVEILVKSLGVREARALDIYDTAFEWTKNATEQAMEAVIHNLNSMHSRAGAQVPFSSLNFGTDTSKEGRMVSFALLKATEEGLGFGETPIFPISIFKMKEGVNYNKGDPNYDLFQEAMRVSAKRLFPNFSNLDAPYNLQYYDPNDFNTEVAFMGCRTRVMGNIYDPSYEKTSGRGNLSFTTINLPRLAIIANGDKKEFFRMLDDRLNLVHRQLQHRFSCQCRKSLINYPFLMGQGMWRDGDKLDFDSDISEVLKNGTLTVGFIGLAEALVALIGKHHGESKAAQKLGLKIVSHMRDVVDKWTKAEKMNYSLIATPAESLSGRFVNIDKKRFGIIPGVTDRAYYTNSMHVPVYYNISAFDKIDIEAPYHSLCNGGSITYIEFEGDPNKNLKAFEKVVRHMHDAGVGYGAINHQVDYDPVCRYSGIIDDVCPRCGRRDGEPMTLEKYNEIKRLAMMGNAKNCGYCGDAEEEADRLPYSISEGLE